MLTTELYGKPEILPFLRKTSPQGENRFCIDHPGYFNFLADIKDASKLELAINLWVSQQAKFLLEKDHESFFNNIRTIWVPFIQHKFADQLGVKEYNYFLRASARMYVKYLANLELGVKNLTSPYDIEETMYELFNNYKFDPDLFHKSSESNIYNTLPNNKSYYTICKKTKFQRMAWSIHDNIYQPTQLLKTEFQYVTVLDKKDIFAIFFFNGKPYSFVNKHNIPFGKIVS